MQYSGLSLLLKNGIPANTFFSAHKNGESPLLVELNISSCANIVEEADLVFKITENAPISVIRSIIDIEKGEFVHQKPIEYIISCDFEATCDDGPVTFKC